LVAVQDLDEAASGIDSQLVAGAEELGYIALEAVNQADAGPGGALRQDRGSPMSGDNLNRR
jgi:hypothetical protein